MPTGKDLLLDQYKRVLVYGRSGAGKTSLIGKTLGVPEMMPLYVFDFDKRINSILAVASHEHLDQLSYDQYRDTTARPGQAFTEAEAKLRELAQTVGKPDGPRTVALDSITFMEKSIASRLLIMNGKQPDAPLELQHYKGIIAQLESFISKLCALPCNVIVTAHEDIDKDELTGMVMRGIGVTGKKLPTVLPGYFNEVWYAEVMAQAGKEPEHKIRVKPTNLIAARTVYSKYLDAVENQDVWEKIFKVDRCELAVAQLAGDAA